MTERSALTWGTGQATEFLEPPPDPLPQINSSDIIIAVMGITGAGKSTFINHLVGQIAPVGHNLTSCTSTVSIYSFLHKHNRRVFLVDTPGFDDTNRTDTQILKDIAYFLSQTYQQNILLSGIIYLHRITDLKMSGSSIRNLNMFKKLCGENAYKNVVLVTNMWGKLTSSVEGERRERELIQRREWWGLMHQRGSQVIRHTDDKNSALAIIDSISSSTGPVLLKIQKQLVDEAKTLEDTDAGQEYEKDLQELKRLHTEQVKELKQEYDQALLDRDTELAETLREQRLELEARLKEASRAQNDLKVTLEQLQEEKTAQFQELASKIEGEQRKTKRLVEEREADLKRFDEDRRRDKQAQREATLKFEHDRTEMQIKIEELEARSQSAAAEQQREHLRQLEEIQATIEARRTQDRNAALIREAQLERQLKDAHDEQRRIANAQAAQRSNANVLQFIAGAGATLVGTVAGQPQLVMGGIGAMAHAAG